MGAAEFEALVTTHRQAVLRTAHRLLGRGQDAEDASQEVFLRLFSKHAEISGNIGAWLYRVTVNICTDHHRRHRPLLPLHVLTADPAPSPECLFRLREREHQLREALQTLTTREHAAVVLRDLKGYPAAEVGLMLGIREVTVRRHVHSARIKLRNYVRMRS